MALWDRQLWESPTSYARFREYYLTQSPPRRLTAAYREYIRHTRGNEAATNITQTPGTWHQWYYAQDRAGRPIPGAVGWEQRGNALDDAQRAERLQALAERRRKHDDRVLALGDRLMERLEQMLDWPLQRVTMDEGKMTVEPVRWDLNTVARLLREYDRVLRLITGAPTANVDLRHSGALAVGQVDLTGVSDEQLDNDIRALLGQYTSATGGALPAPAATGREATVEPESEDTGGG